jgi:hypothetical protein
VRFDIPKLLKRNLLDLRQHFLDENAAIPEGFLEALKNDPRNGARQLAV